MFTVCQQASSQKSERNVPYVADLRSPEHRWDTHHVVAFYSKSKSFLKLMQASGKLPCDKDATVRAQYIIQGEELTKEQEILHFFYLVNTCFFLIFYLGGPYHQVALYERRLTQTNTACF